MTVGRICVRDVHIAEPDESVRVATRRMRKVDVGALIVTDDKRNPIGILTDRDVALRCVAEGQEPDDTPVSEIMTAPCFVSPSLPRSRRRYAAWLAFRHGGWESPTRRDSLWGFSPSTTWSTSSWRRQRRSGV